MQKGDFDVIKGKGKPLKPTAENPYTDFMTTKINEILINNGYQPEWVELGKEIRRDTQEAKDRWESYVNLMLVEKWFIKFIPNV